MLPLETPEMTHILQTIEENAKLDKVVDKHDKAIEDQEKIPDIGKLDKLSKQFRKSKYKLPYRGIEQFSKQSSHGPREMYCNSILRFIIPYEKYRAVQETFNALIMYSVVSEVECYRIPYFGFIRIGKKRRTDVRATNYKATKEQGQVVKYLSLNSLRYHIVMDWDHSEKIFLNPQRLLKLDLSRTTARWMHEYITKDDSIVPKIYNS